MLEVGIPRLRGVGRASNGGVDVAVDHRYQEDQLHHDGALVGSPDAGAARR